MWHSRTWKLYPDDLREKWKTSVGGCIVGPVSWSEEADGFKGVKSWKVLKEGERVWRNGEGEVAMQYGFVGMEGMVKLNGEVEVGWERLEGV